MNLILIIERFMQRSVCVIDVNLIVLSICHSIINAGNFRLFIYLFILYQEAYFCLTLDFYNSLTEIVDYTYFLHSW